MAEDLQSGRVNGRLVEGSSSADGTDILRSGRHACKQIPENYLRVSMWHNVLIVALSNISVNTIHVPDVHVCVCVCY